MTLLLVTLFLKSLIVCAAAGLLLLALRRASASTRHLVCLWTLAALLALPLFSLALPGWHLPVLSTNNPVGAPLAAPSTPALSLPDPPVPQSKRQKTASQEGAASGAPTEMETSAEKRPFPWLLVGIAFYAVGVVVASLRPLLGLWGIHRLRRACAAMTAAPVLAVFAGCARLLGVSPPCLCRAAVPVPMTWGWHRPVVVLPEDAAGWPTARLRSVLLHEMAHVRRRDWPGHRLADLACAVYWFHPLIWLIARRLRAESEVACDDLVLASGVPAPEYARHLLDIASTLPSVPNRSQAAIAMAQTSRIERRLLMLLDTTQSRRILTRRVLLVALVPSTAALVGLAVLRPDAKAQASPSITGASSPAVTSSQSPLLFLWPSGSSVHISFRPGDGTIFTARPNLMTMTATNPTKKGTTLFAGITDANKPGNPWWNYSGIPLSKPLYETTFDHPLTVTGAKGERSLVFAFRLPQEARDVTTIFEAPNSVISSSAGQWPGKMQGQENATEAMLNRTTGGMRMLEVVYPASVEKASLRVGFGTGPWRVAASKKVSQSGINYIGPSFIVGEPVETPKGYSLTVSTDSSDDLRIIGVDTYGHELLPNLIGGESVNKLDQITAQFNLPLSQIKEFRVETRPFQWIEFKDVALQPIKQSRS